MAKTSVHFILKDGSSYRDLAPVFRDLLYSALDIVDQVLEEEDMEMVVRNNLDDLEQDRKPEGYLRKVRVRMVFPMDRKEFYFQSYSPKQVDLGMIANRTKEILNGAGISYDYTEDDAVTFDINPKKR